MNILILNAKINITSSVVWIKLRKSTYFNSIHSNSIDLSTHLTTSLFISSAASTQPSIDFPSKWLNTSSEQLLSGCPAYQTTLDFMQIAKFIFAISVCHPSGRPVAAKSGDYMFRIHLQFDSCLKWYFSQKRKKCAHTSSLSIGKSARLRDTCLGMAQFAVAPVKRQP